jgi:hypothetical protein
MATQKNQAITHKYTSQTSLPNTRKLENPKNNYKNKNHINKMNKINNAATTSEQANPKYNRTKEKDKREPSGRKDQEEVKGEFHIAVQGDRIEVVR